MKNIQFPVSLKFHIGTLSNDFTATNADGRVLAFVKQKLFKFKEDISIYSDTSKSELTYKIKADRWIDFNAAYSITKVDGSELGKIARKGWRSLWKAKYLIIDQNGKEQYSIEEENEWIKVWDNLLGEIPILGLLTRYFFNPSYAVSDNDGIKVTRLKKTRSMIGRRFQIDKLADINHDDQERIILSLMMMILLERHRG
jgi:uncharacterized protein YxjI